MYTCTHVCVYCSIIHAIQDSTSHAVVLSPDSFKLQNGFSVLSLSFMILSFLNYPGKLFHTMLLGLSLSDVSFWGDSSHAYFDRDVPETMSCSQCILSGGTWFSFSQYQSALITFLPCFVIVKYFFFFPLQGICILGERLWDHGNILFLKILLTTLISHWWFLPEFRITKTIAQYLWLSGSITLYKFINCFSTAKKSSLLSPSF